MDTFYNLAYFFKSLQSELTGAAAKISIGSGQVSYGELPQRYSVLGHLARTLNKPER